MDVLQTSGIFMLQYSFSVKTALKSVHSVYRIKSIQKSPENLFKIAEKNTTLCKVLRILKRILKGL